MLNSPAPSTSAGELIVVSAPSGAGKTTLVRNLFASPLIASGSLEFSVSHTTRSPRGKEVDGVEYYFVDDEEFDRRIAEHSFLEWAHVHGRKYGTSKSEVEKRLEDGKDVLLEIDVQGAEQIRSTYPQAFMVFILPPSYEELERRLSGRGQDAVESIRKRLAVSLWEIERYELYDCVIINADLERASADLVAAVQARRVRRERIEPRIRQVIKDFKEALGE